MRTTHLSGAAARRLFAGFLLLGVPALSSCATSEPNHLPAAASESEQQRFVESAQVAVATLRNSPTVGSGVNSYLQNAKAVLVFPDLLRGGFVFGAAGGTAALLARKPNGEWSDPAFYLLLDASLGLQIGGEGGQVLLAIMNDSAVNKIVDGNSINLGGDLSVAVGPFGGGAQGATTTNLGADVVAFGLQEGAFAGVAAQLGALHPRGEWNADYYGPGATPRAIVLEHRFRNLGDRALRAALATSPAGSHAATATGGPHQ
jgi:SH3 domain-containing YSC84-like protein 1